MAEDAGPTAVPVVLCTGCGDVVPSAGACPTCGRLEPRAKGVRATEVLDEGLLDRVDVALAAQAALACATAAERLATARRVYEEAVVLQRRLRRQQELLREVAAPKELMPKVTDALRRVGGALQSRPVNGTVRWTIDARLPRDSSCSAVARRLLEGFVQELDEEAGENAMLIASELVTNAFLHGQGEIAISACRIDGVLRIEVRDEGRPEHIDVTPQDRRGDRGRGLWIVEQLARRWGAVANTGQVWAEVAVGGGAAIRSA